MTDCSHGMPVDWCALCRDNGLGPDPSDETHPPSTPSVSARFAGKCGGCGDPIQVGDTITLVDEGWVCEACSVEGAKQ